MALLTDLLTGFVGQGARRLAMINTGVSTEAPLRIVVRDFYAAHGVRVAVADLATLGRAASPGSGRSSAATRTSSRPRWSWPSSPAPCGWSGPSPTTATWRKLRLSVFYQPVVFDADPGSGPDWSRTGARGDPSLATRETGEAALREITRELVDGLVALYPDLAADTRA